MSEAGVDQRPREPRVSLGVADLDEMLSGGLMPHRPYLVVGPAGTGKTTLALQFLCEGVRHGERCLYVTMEDPPNEVRWNHRALRPELDSVEVFDAIPDVMRYERAPFKDISATRQVVAFRDVADVIRQTPEFTSVEVTATALEQMLRSEVHRRGYTRLVIDSLTALQYFCMKGFDPVVGAQTFLRFLTDLRTTTLLTVEAPLEDVEGPERMLARGEIRLFRWELEGVTVRAVGVEKLRGSSHDVRLHPYRIGPRGLDVQLVQTISRDTRQIVEPALTVALGEEAPAAPGPSAALPSVVVSEPLSQQIDDLVKLGVDITPLRTEVEATLDAVRAARTTEVVARLTRISALAISLAPIEPPPSTSAGSRTATAQAFQRVVARADRIREGRAPTQPPPSEVLARELGSILALVPSTVTARTLTPAAPAAAPPPAAIPPPAAPAAVAPPPPAPRPVPPPPAERPARAAPTIEMARPELPTPELPPRSAPAAPAHVPPPARPTARRAARRTPPAVAAAEPPPLPTVFSLPTAPAPPAPPPTPGPVAVGQPVSGPAAPVVSPKTAAPRRRRRVSAAKPSVGPGTEPAPAPETAPGTAPAAPKPRKRTVRRKKAPPVVSATAVPPPEEAPAPAAPPPPAEPAPSDATPPEGR